MILMDILRMESIMILNAVDLTDRMWYASCCDGDDDLRLNVRLLRYRFLRLCQQLPLVIYLSYLCVSFMRSIQGKVAKRAQTFSHQIGDKPCTFEKVFALTSS